MLALLPLFVLLLQTSSPGCDVRSERPLFDCDERLAVTIELPMKTLLREAEDRPLLDGRLVYEAADGEQVALDVRVMSRGHSRLVICSFPPLSISFHPSQVEGTVFAGQTKLKIVTQCKRGSRYLDYLKLEYGIYRAFNQVSDIAFRVRLLEITFRDSERANRERREFAFVIESVDEIEVRSNLEAVKEKRASPGQLDKRYAAIYELFQFMIGNTDWSMLKGPGDENCCHNGKLLRPPGAEQGWIVVPYDFDQAGVISTPYALPHEELPIRSVRQRLYRGRCAHLATLEEDIALFNERRDAIEAALASGGLSQRAERKQATFIAGFYEVVNNPAERTRHIVGRCRGGT